jgi:N-formylglutamate amidohydrolase
LKKILLNIPHSSTFFPDKTGFVLERLDHEVSLLTAWYSDKIFCIPGITNIIAETSRVYCDVERLPDELEPMAQVGMGIVYTQTDNAQTLRTISKSKKGEIIRKYYEPYHEKLTNLVAQKLERYSECLIIDCHTFSNTPFQRDMNQTLPRPDICIGTDPFHTPLKLTEIIAEHFSQFSVS